MSLNELKDRIKEGQELQVQAISGISPRSGETVDGETLEKDYNLLKKELMQVLRSHKLTAGQALYLLSMCREEIDVAMNRITVF